MSKYGHVILAIRPADRYPAINEISCGGDKNGSFPCFFDLRYVQILLGNFIVTFRVLV